MLYSRFSVLQHATDMSQAVQRIRSNCSTGARAVQLVRVFIALRHIQLERRRTKQAHYFGLVDYLSVLPANMDITWSHPYGNTFRINRSSKALARSRRVQSKT